MSDIPVAASPPAPTQPTPSPSTSQTSPLLPASAPQGASHSAPGASQSPQPGVAGLPAAGTSAAGAAAEAATGTRPFRSKKVRPCDGCRKRKNRQTGRQCTFLLPPPVRPKKEPAPAGSTSLAATAPPLYPASFTIPPAPSTTQAPSSLGDERSSAPDSASLPEKRLRDETEPFEEPASKRAAPSPPAPGGSLVSLDQGLPPDIEPCAVTATLTDDLLTHRTVGSSRQISSDRCRSQFILFHARPPHRLASDDYQHVALRQLRSFIAYAVPEVTESALLQHYLIYLHPALPVLPLNGPDALDNIPAGLRALLLASALSYFPEHKKAAAYAWSLLKQEKLAEKMLEVPRLSSLAAVLVELDTTLDPRNDFALLAKAIAHAQLLGASFLNSRPSHIQTGNTNVPLPPFPTPDDTPESYNDAIAFAYTARLASVASRLQIEVSTLDKYGSASRADACDHLEAELNSMQQGARPWLELSRRPVGMDAFCFTLLALRCMIRRVSIEIRIGLGNSFMPDGNTLAIFSDLVKLVASLSKDSLDGRQPWICYSSHILSSVLSSLIRLSLAAVASKHNTPPSTADPSRSSPHPASSSAVHLLADLCLSLDAAYRSYGWSVAEAALNRATSVADRLAAATQADGGGEDYGEVIAALRREPIPSSPTTFAGAGAAGPLDGLHALASLADGGSVGATATMDNLALDDFGLPDLGEWLNCLDDGLKWGGSDGSPSGWGLAQW
ncbi:hypothetical protein JCM10213v2_001035 [Rhodosporidiobolus nylandii]